VKDVSKRVSNAYILLRNGWADPGKGGEAIQISLFNNLLGVSMSLVRWQAFPDPVVSVILALYHLQIQMATDHSTVFPQTRAWHCRFWTRTTWT
jgi:hypothetical protein